MPGPIPPYNNPPIQPQFYKPSFFFISNIVIGLTTLVTTAVNDNYVIGQLVRLLIPPAYGCSQLNEQEGYVLSLPASNQVEVGINSYGGNPFISNPPNQKNKPQIVPVGDINSGVISSTGRNVPTTAIPGSFINISA